MGAVVAMVVVLVIGVGILVGFLYEPKHLALKGKNRSLAEEITRLNRIMAEKDKELEARRLGLPWYDVEKETHGTQE